MSTTDDVLDASRLCFEGDFDTQVQNIMTCVRLTAAEVCNLRTLFSDLEQAIKILAPGLQVMPFGSIVTGLGIKTSDVDCYIALPTKPDNRIVIHARNILRRHYRKFTNLFAIANASVPIVKFLHIPTNCNCDVNFKSPAGVQNSNLIGFLLQSNPSQHPLHLAILVKYWSKVHKMTGTNLLASYALTMMVIFYLQLINVLPSVLELQRHVPPYMIDNWNTAFDKDNVSNNDCDNLYNLLGGFFKCYACMNFDENIISPYLGRLINKKLFKNFEDVPEEFNLYKNNLQCNECKSLNIDSPLCVQDPFEHSRNSSGSVYPKLAMRIKAHFKFAAQKFDELPPDRFLEAILVEDPNKAAAPKPKKQTKHVFHNKVVKHKHISNYRPGAQTTNRFNKYYEKLRQHKQ